MRQLAWFKTPMKRIEAMDFSPTGQWLMCITGDSTVFLIPLYFLMHKKMDLHASQEPDASSLSDSSSPATSTNVDSPSSASKNKNPNLSRKVRGMSLRGKREKPNRHADSPDWANASSRFSVGESFPSLMNYAQSTVAANSKSPRATETASFGSINDVTVITACSRPRIVGVTQCLWWKAWDGDYGIISTSAGKLSIIDFYSHKEAYVLRLGHPIRRMHLVIDPQDTYKYLLIETKGAGFYKLLLEQKITDHTYHNIISAAPSLGKLSKSSSNTLAAQKNPFAITLLPAFSEQQLSEGLVLSVQHTQQGCFIGAYRPSAHTFEVFGPELGKFPLFVYQLPFPASHIQLTDKLLFAVGQEEGKTAKVYVVSKWNAATSSEPQWFYKHNKKSVMQEFVLPPQEMVGGVFPTFSSAPRGMGIPTNVRRSGSFGDFLNNESSGLEGFFFWTNTTLYQCKPFHTPEQIFFSLISSGQEKVEAELLGKTMGLDLLTLYERAADANFAAGNHERALELYNLSNVGTSKLIYKFQSISRMSVVISHLSQTLALPAALSVRERRRLSDILFKCYLQSILDTSIQESDSEAIHSSFCNFLVHNQDYDTSVAMDHLLDNGLTSLFFQVAQAKRSFGPALHKLVRAGYFHLEPQELRLLTEGEFINELASRDGRTLLRHLPLHVQLDIYLTPTAICTFFHRTFSILPDLDKSSLRRVARAFDPLNSTVLAQMRRQRKRANSISAPSSTTEIGLSSVPPEEEFIEEEEYIELFLTCLLILNRNASLHEGYQEDIQDADQQQTTKVVDIPSSMTFHPIIKKVACGRHHICAVTDGGVLYVWGENQYGQLGLAGESLEAFTFISPQSIPVLNSHTVVDVACGDFHTFARTALGQVFAWGRGDRGQLGLGDDLGRNEPTLVTDNLVGVSIRMIACGHAHTVLMTDTREVYVCGAGDNGQLMLGRCKDVLVPTKVETVPKNVCQIAVGHSHTVLLTESGDVFVCGNNESGQLGLSTQAFPPYEINLTTVEALHGKRIKKIACGAFHTVALTDLDNVYVWGSGLRARDTASRHKSSSNNNKAISFHQPQIVRPLMGKSVKDVACGYGHTIALTADNHVYAWESLSISPNATSLSASPSRARSTSLYLMPSFSGVVVMSVGGGDGFSVVVSDKGELFSWGKVPHHNFGPIQHEPSLVSFPHPSSVSSPRRLLADKLEMDDATIQRYDQHALEVALRRLFKTYRPTLMLQRCIQWSNWSAAAILHTLLGNDREALLCRLNDITMANKGETQEITSVLRLFSTLQEQKDCDEKKASLIDLILRFWQERKLPVEPLEDFLQKNLSHLGQVLGIVLQHYDQPDSPFRGLAFSNELFKNIAHICMSRLTSHLHSSNSSSASSSASSSSSSSSSSLTPTGQLSEEALWKEISATLFHSQWNKRAFIDLPSSQLSNSTASAEEDGEVVAFTCDKAHSFPRKTFFERVLPNFKSLLAAFPKEAALPLTSEALQAEYQQRIIRLACPICLYNTLHFELSQRYPSLSAS
ncbi:negative regulation of SNARE complex assembly, variant 2 [Balamuthia mandrillaris]